MAVDLDAVVPAYSIVIVNPQTGTLDPVWYNFFLQLFTRTEVLKGSVTSVTGAAPIVSTGGTTPVISINAATPVAAGSMSAADKGKLDSVTSGAAISVVTGTAPIVSSGGTSPAISINAATPSAPGSLSAADKTKLDSLTSGAAVASVGATAPIVSSGGTSPTISINAATPSAPGSLSAADKTKLDSVASGAAVASVGATAPITSSGGANPNIGISAATTGAAGSMSAADKTILDAMTTGGTWTPTLTCAVPGDLAVTYASRLGFYTKVGRLVTLHFLVSTSAYTWTTASGTLTITGLPFTSNASGTGAIPGVLDWGGITKAGFTSIVCEIGNSSTALAFISSGSGVARGVVSVADTPSGGTVVLAGQITYFV